MSALRAELSSYTNKTLLGECEVARRGRRTARLFVLPVTLGSCPPARVFPRGRRACVALRSNSEPTPEFPPRTEAPHQDPRCVHVVLRSCPPARGRTDLGCLIRVERPTHIVASFSTAPPCSVHLRAIGNWQEDRNQAPRGDTANRVVITDPQFSGYSTSAQAIGGTYDEPRKEVKKTMLAGGNFHEIHVNRNSSLPAKGYNATLPSHPDTEFATYRETTYGKFFESDPADAKANGAPIPEQGDDTRFRGGYPANCNPVRPNEPMYSTSRAFFNKGQMKKDFFDTSKRPDFRGSYGSRGANVRVPEESGSRSVVTVHADMYSLGQ